MKSKFTLVIVDEDNKSDDPNLTVEQRLRGVVKRLLRSYRFRLVQISEVKQTQEGENQR